MRARVSLDERDSWAFHRNANLSLRRSGSVVNAVCRHRHESTFGLKLLHNIYFLIRRTSAITSSMPSLPLLSRGLAVSRQHHDTKRDAYGVLSASLRDWLPRVVDTFLPPSDGAGGRHKNERNIPTGMQKVYRRLDGWRRKRRGRSAIPQPLWVPAAAVARERD